MTCPICKSSNTRYFANKDGYLFHRCTSCKTLFISNMPTQKILTEYYANQFSYTDGLINENIIRIRGKIILRKLHQLAPLAKTLCDIGSGYGFFLDEARKRGICVFGVEPSRQLVHHAFKEYSINSFLGTLEEFVRKRRRQFDVVTCIHVIEHVPKPKHFICNLLKLVKPRGLLYIETPNADSHLLYVERENYTFLIPPHHLWIFSKESIKKLLPENFQIIHANTYSYPEHLMGIVKRTVKNLASKTSEKTHTKFILSNVEGLDPSDNHLRMTQKRLSYFLFDRLLAPLFTGLLNAYHKGSILELYIKKK